MPRSNATSFQNNFVGGFVTQATALDFPENAAFDQDNVVFSEIGIAERRPGFEFENNALFLTEDRKQLAQVTFLWKNVAGDGNTNMAVQQNGGTLHFYSTASSLSLSAGLSANTVALSSFAAAGATSDNLGQNECQFSSGLGYLFVVHPFCDPFYIKFNSDGTFSSSIISFTIRDVFGIVEAGNIDNRPSSLNANHTYNLFNQGWDNAKITTMHTALVSTYPSNADVWWTFKDSNDVFNPGTMLASVSRGSSPAPQGYFRLSPWNTARAATALAQAGLSLSLTGTVDETSGTARPSVTEFHAGRVWYAGVSAQGYNSRIYVSQVIEDPTNFGACCAQDDPTSETLFDSLATDGVVIAIPQAGTIYKLISLGATLLVFGANGVWAINGSQGIGFTATDFAVSPIGYTRSISSTSFVTVDNTVLWWNLTGINAVVNDPQAGLMIKSLTDPKIKDFFINGIPSSSKRAARGAYNPRTHQIFWLYTSGISGDITSMYTYDKLLCFNTLIQAFYTWTVPITTVAINSILTFEGTGSITGSNLVVDRFGAQVIDNSGNNVTTFGFSQTTIQTTTKFLCSYTSGGSYKFTFAEVFNPDYLDWQQFDAVGVDYVSYFVTGYNVKTQGERNFQSNYLFVFDDTSSGLGTDACTLQTLWNYANNRNSGRWTQKQVLTFNDTNFDAARKRLKVRGSGVAVQFKFSSLSGQPFNIVGWSTADTANTQV